MKYAVQRAMAAALEISDTALLFHSCPPEEVPRIEWAIEHLRAAINCAKPVIDCTAEAYDGDTYRVAPE